MYRITVTDADGDTSTYDAKFKSDIPLWIYKYVEDLTKGTLQVKIEIDEEVEADGNDGAN